MCGTGRGMRLKCLCPEGQLPMRTQGVFGACATTTPHAPISKMQPDVLPSLQMPNKAVVPGHPPEHMLAFWAPCTRVVLLLRQLEQAAVELPFDHLL